MEKDNRIKIEVAPDVAEGVYVNLAVISHTSAEFVIDAASIMPGIPKATVKSRLILAPEHAKRLALALQENIIKYESQFGKINIPNQNTAVTPPFNVNGEA